MDHTPWPYLQHVIHEPCPESFCNAFHHYWVGTTKTNSAKKTLSCWCTWNSSFCGDPGKVNKKALVVLNQTKSTAICKLKQLYKHLWGCWSISHALPVTCRMSRWHLKFVYTIKMMKSSIDNPLKLATQNDDVVFRSVGDSRGRRQVIQTIIVNAQS